MSELSTKDIKGMTVRAGTLVRVLSIDHESIADLDGEAKTRVASMQNAKFAVYEIDQWGRAWVEKWWYEDEANATCHCIALDPHQMEICSES